MRLLRLSSIALVCGAALLAGCSDADAPTEPGSQFTTIQFNAASAPAYLTLGTTAGIATVTDPQTSDAWDLVFTPGFEIKVNGGASGPAGVKAYCLCANASLTQAQVEALTARDGAEAFAAVTAASIPADGSFESDEASRAIDGWYSYNSSTHAITPSDKAWGIRLASTQGGIAKFHVKAIPTPSMSNAGPVTIEWALQTGGAMGVDQTTVVDLTSGSRVYVNLTTGATSTTATGTWDVALEGYTITVNGGASGSGNVSALELAPSTSFATYAAITSVPASIPASAYSTDGTGGAFLANPPYRYDGTTHQLWPTYDVYLVKRGTAVYKVQVVTYYSTSGTAGTVTLRYAKLAE
jgi:hypothetical protein